jgi:hypothetical protein
MAPAAPQEMRTWTEAEEAGKKAGFELVTSLDVATASVVAGPWWSRLKMGHFQHKVNSSIVNTLQFLGLAPKVRAHHRAGPAAPGPPCPLHGPAAGGGPCRTCRAPCASCSGRPGAPPRPFCARRAQRPPARRPSQGLKQVHDMLSTVAFSLVDGGETGVFTPMHLLVFRKK